MNNLLIKILTKIIKPFYWTWIWKYPPFYQINKFYKKINSNKDILFYIQYWFKMYLNWSKFIDQEIIFNWYWEKNITTILFKELKEWNIFIDIWANIWYFSLLWSKIVWKTWKVISFEPSKINFNKLEKNIKVNNLNNLLLYKLWVWNIENKFEIFYDDENPGATSLIKNKKNKYFKKEIIKVIKLDNFLKNKKIDFIKMDIEWFEYEAILWMKYILKNNDIKLIFEYSPIIYKNKEINYKEYSIHLLKTLKKYWFYLYHINEVNWNLEYINNYSKYYEKINSNKIGQSDIICFKIKI